VSFLSFNIEPKTALMKEPDDSLPYSLPISMASSIITLGGTEVAEKSSSKMARRRTERSTRLILSTGHLGAWRVITASIEEILERILVILGLGIVLVDSQAKRYLNKPILF